MDVPCSIEASSGRVVSAIGSRPHIGRGMTPSGRSARSSILLRGNDGARLAAPELREHDGVVVLGVASAVDERQRGLARSSAELSQLLLLCGELLDVPLSELREAGGVVAEPAPQLR